MTLKEHDSFIVIASDGVWEFITNEEAAQIIYPHRLINNSEKAARVLVQESLKRWQ